MGIHIHTHTRIYLYVCVCVCKSQQHQLKMDWNKVRRGDILSHPCHPCFSCTLTGINDQDFNTYSPHLQVNSPKSEWWCHIWTVNVVIGTIVDWGDPLSISVSLSGLNLLWGRTGGGGGGAVNSMSAKRNSWRTWTRRALH